MKILIVDNSATDKEINIVKKNLEKKFSYVGRLSEKNKDIFNKLIKTEVKMYEYLLVYESSFQTNIDFYFYLGFLKKFNLKGLYVKTKNGLEIEVDNIIDLTKK